MLQNIDSVLGRVSAARKAIALAGDELKAGLVEAGINERTIEQLIADKEIVGYEVLSAALTVQSTLQEVITLSNDLRQKKRHGFIIGWPPNNGLDEDEEPGGSGSAGADTGDPFLPDFPD